MASVICLSICHKLSMLRQSGKIQQPILPLLRRFLQISKKEIYCHIPLRMTSVKAFNTKTHSAKSASETCQTVNEIMYTK